MKGERSWLLKLGVVARTREYNRSLNGGSVERLDKRMEKGWWNSTGFNIERRYLFEEGRISERNSTLSRCALQN